MTVAFAGTAAAPDYWVRANAAQEGGNGHWNGGYGPGGITGWAAGFLAAPTVKMRFTYCSVVGCQSGENHFGDDVGCLLLDLVNCQFAGSAVGGYATAGRMTNCLFERTSVVNTSGPGTNSFYILRNCTIKGGAVGGASSLTMRDCALDGSAFVIPAGSGSLDFDYNAFLNGAVETIPAGAHDIVLTNFAWAAGPLGDYYQPVNGPLARQGDVAAVAAGLRHYTTTTDQAMEGTNAVSLGFHYVALARNGWPLISNTNGVPDYVADALAHPAVAAAGGAAGSLAMNNMGVMADDIQINNLIDVYFNCNLAGYKTGFAAVGMTASDYWNNTVSGPLPALEWVNGAASGAGLSVSGNSGAWSWSVSDHMYQDYIYGYGTTMTVTVTNLPDGNYDFLVYAHGDQANQNQEVGLTTGTQIDGPWATADTGTNWETANWQNGQQYILFSNVAVLHGTPIAITVANGDNDTYSCLNGIQIAQLPSAAPSTLVDVAFDCPPGGKTGFAAIGVTASDYWNATVANPIPALEWVNGANTGAGLSVAGALNAWTWSVPDNMYKDYIWGGGTVTVTVTNMPDGTYNFASSAESVGEFIRFG